MTTYILFFFGLPFGRHINNKTPWILLCFFQYTPLSPPSAKAKMSTSTPAKRIENMTPEERLQSLRDFVEQKKYVQPGEDGTLPSGQAGMAALAFGGPMRQQGGEYTAPLAPPSYSSAVGEQVPAEKERRPSLIARLLGKKGKEKEK